MTFDSRTDKLFRSVLILSKLFTTSWGRVDTLKDLLLFKRECTSQRLMQDFIREFTPEMKIKKESREKGVVRIDALFTSPYSLRFPSHCPPPINQSYLRFIIPPNGTDKVCIHLAGTGDHSYWRREWGLVNPLLKEGIASIIVVNPFYAQRKPKNQLRSSIHNVSDLFVMGASLISECLFMLDWSKERYGFDKAVISGVSMGGFMASLAATNVPYPIGCVPCLSSVCAGPTYTEGILKDAINWSVLDKELRDRDYVRGIESIPDCDWIYRAHEERKRNGFSLSYNFMRILMEEFTHLAKYPTPVSTRATISLLAENDAYIVQNGLPLQSELWQGSQVRYVSGGHVTTYVANHDAFRKCISDSFKLL